MEKSNVRNGGIKNNIDALLKAKKNKRSFETGKKVTLTQLMHELSDFCDIGFDAITQYKRNYSFPSLPVSFRISQYFGLSIEQVFVMEDYSIALGDRSNKSAGRKKMEYNKECSVCGSDKVVAKGLCNKHYPKRNK